MSVHLVGVETLGTVNDGRPPLAARVLVKTIAIVLTVAHKIVEEVVYMVREDLSHGRIERDPEDWERG